MAESNTNTVSKYKCRSDKCSKRFTDESNRNRHEKRFKHYKPRGKVQYANVVEVDGVFKCYTCEYTSQLKKNVVRHIKNGCKVVKKKTNTKECPHCKKTFARKSNCDRHIENIHGIFKNDNNEIQPSFIPQNVQVDLECDEETIVGDDTVDEGMIEDDSTGDSVEDMILDSSQDITEVGAHSSVQLESSYLEGPSLMSDDPNLSFINPSFPATEDFEGDIDFGRSGIEGGGPNMVNSTTNSATGIQMKKSRCSLSSIVEKLARDAEQQCSMNMDQKCEKVFLNHILEKLEQDVKCASSRSKAAEFLMDTFGDMVLVNEDFVCWLSKKLGYDRPMRLVDIIKKHTLDLKKWRPRNSFAEDVHRGIYAYWLKPEVSITTVERRNGRDEVRLTKTLYQRDFHHLQGIPDENIRGKEIVLKKTGNRKEIVVAHKMIFIEPIRQLHKKFVELSGKDCSLSTFYKYKPFYVSPPTEREKETCLCMKCTNIHFLLDAINRYRKKNKLKAYDSVTQYLAAMKEVGEDKQQFPEVNELKKTQKYGYFASKTESYLRDGKTITYTRTARRDMTEPVTQLVKLMVDSGPAYLKHRSHVENISNVLPVIKNSFTGNFIELDFSENLAITPKHEVQDAHFSGKQYALHCAIVEPGEPKFIYHLSDDTKHDSVFVHQVLIDIFDKWNIRNETIVIKSDNAPTQYKNKYAFASMQTLADTYNVKIVRLFGAAGHGKGLIDAMSSFGVKSVIRRDIVTKDDWFSNSQEIVDHLQFRGDPRMYYKVLQPEILDKARQNPKERKIVSCMKMHLFVFKPKETDVYMQEYLCDCSSCISFNFDECEKQETVAAVEEAREKSSEEGYDYEDECNLDEQLKSDNVFEFVEKGSFVAMASDDEREPLYFAKITDKNIAKDDETLHDRFGHTVFPGQRYLTANYLKLTRSKKTTFKQYSILNSPIYILPDEVLETFVDIQSDLSLDMGTYSSLIRSAQDI